MFDVNMTSRMRLSSVQIGFYGKNVGGDNTIRWVGGSPGWQAGMASERTPSQLSRYPHGALAGLSALRLVRLICLRICRNVDGLTRLFYGR